jgi:hypothetical protein
MPFAQYVWNEVIKSVQADINNETAYFGFDKEDAVAYNAGNAYVVGNYVTFAVNGITEYFLCVTNAAIGDTPATDPEKWLNVTARAVAKGLKYHLDEAISDGDLTEIAIGAMNSAADAKLGFKEMYRTIPAPYKKGKIVFRSSYNIAELLLDGLEDITKYTMPDVSALVKQGLIPIPGTNFNGWVKPTTWLGNSGRIIGEPMLSPTGMGANLCMGTDLLSDSNDIAQVKDLWTIDAGIATDLAFNFHDPEALWINDQE